MAKSKMKEKLLEEQRKKEQIEKATVGTSEMNPTTSTDVSSDNTEETKITPLTTQSLMTEVKSMIDNGDLENHNVPPIGSDYTGVVTYVPPKIDDNLSLEIPEGGEIVESTLEEPKELKKEVLGIINKTFDEKDAAMEIEKELNITDETAKKESDRETPVDYTDYDKQIAENIAKDMAKKEELSKSKYEAPSDMFTGENNVDTQKPQLKTNCVKMITKESDIKIIFERVRKLGFSPVIINNEIIAFSSDSYSETVAARKKIISKGLRCVIC